MELTANKTDEPMSNIQRTEIELASQLKQICNPNGQEIDSAKSIPILHQLGKLYYLKGKQGPDLVCLIQSAALYNAAIARSAKNAVEIEQDLCQLCDYVLVQSGAQNQNTDLKNQSKSVKNEFKKLRDNVKQKLKSIPEIPNAVTKNELENLEKQKIASVRSIQNYITLSYTKIMANVAEYCHWIMGKAPCRFAVIGMGSLARKEITPYSDFEHIIALEDEFASKCTQKEMEEVVIPYYKWFSVVFHIIVINLQETILPSVAIPSLNDFYTEEKEDNWFFDGFTSRGVSFDGLMPHACKLPIGRQKLTKQKTWKTELIKPVTNMLEYLTRESQLKNGYHLCDILTKTCFVYGNQLIYDQFSAGVVKILKDQTNTERINSVKIQINDDLESFATRNTLFQLYMKKKINIKSIAYRSSTLFIAALGRLHCVEKSSCFEIIETLAQMHKISELAKHKQMYAVALACEIRLRWYMQNESQNESIVANTSGENVVETLFSIVGKLSTKSYFQIAYSLQSDISKRLGLKQVYFHSNPQLLNFSIAICLIDLIQPKMIVSKTEIQASKFDRLYDFDKCIQILENEETNNQSIVSKDDGILTPGFAQLQQAGDILCELDCYDDASEYYQKSLQILMTDISSTSKELDYTESGIDNLCKTDPEKAQLLSLNLKQIGNCFRYTNKLTQAMEYLKKSAAIWKAASLNAAKDSKLASVLHICGQCCKDLSKFEEAKTYFEKALQICEQATTNAETDADLATALHSLGRCLLDMNHINEALNCFERALRIHERTTTYAETYTSLAVRLHETGRCLLDMKKYNEALKLFEIVLKICERETTNDKIDTSLARALHSIGECLLQMKQYNDALQYFDRELQILQQATINAETDTSLAATLIEIGRCLLGVNQHNEAFKHLERAQQIQERATANAETDSRLAMVLYEIGKCFLGMNQQHNKAMKYFERALEIFERSTTNAETDRNIAFTTHEIGRCLVGINQYKKALVYFQNAKQIFELATTNAEADTDLANALQSLGRCLVHLNQHNEALKNVVRALKIKEVVTKNAETDRSLAETTLEFGRCLLHMNQNNEALKKFEKALQILEQTTANADTDIYLAATLHEIGKCLLEMEQHEEALQYFEKALQIKELAAKNTETDTSLAATMYELGHCLLVTNEPKRALSYFEKALKIQEQATTNAETDTSLVVILQYLGQCLQEMNQPNEALKYLKRSLQIRQELTTNADTDTKIAVLFFQLGQCLLNMGQHEEALNHLKRGLQIFEQATANAETATNLAVTLKEIGRCLLGMKQHNEAFKCFEKALLIEEQASTNADNNKSKQ